MFINFLKSRNIFLQGNSASKIPTTLGILFSSNHNIHKSSFCVCFDSNWRILVKWTLKILLLQIKKWKTKSGREMIDVYYFENDVVAEDWNDELISIA